RVLPEPGRPSASTGAARRPPGGVAPRGGRDGGRDALHRRGRPAREALHLSSTALLRWGILGAAWIAGRAVLPAITASRNGMVVAIASRSADRAQEMAAAHGITQVHASYEALL